MLKPTLASTGAIALKEKVASMVKTGSLPIDFSVTHSREWTFEKQSKIFQKKVAITHRTAANIVITKDLIGEL